MIPKTVLILTAPSSAGHKPFAAHEVLFKPVVRWVADAASALGVTRVSLRLADADARIAGVFSDGTAVFTREALAAYASSDPPDPAAPAAALLRDDLLLLADDAIGVTPALLGELCARSPSALYDAERPVAALLPAPDVLGWLHAGADWDALPLPRLDVRSFAPDYIGFTAPNTRELLRVSERLRADILRRLLDFGVVIAATDGVLVGPDVTVGADTVLLPGTELRGGTIVGNGCVLGPNTVITDSVIADGCAVESSKVTRSLLHEGVRVGPFSQLRPGSELARAVKVGDFVEIKNSYIGESTAVAHLTYLGDSDVGARVNVGCGVVTCNYDGVAKHRTTIGDDVFIGCNTNLIAPVSVGDGAYTAAGSTINRDVPSGALAIARARQENKAGYAERLLQKE